MKVKYEDIDKIISILQKAKEGLKPGEYYTFTNDKVNKGEPYHIVVTEENLIELSKWRFDDSNKLLSSDQIAGMVLRDDGKLYKSNNPISGRRSDSNSKRFFDFGREVTIEEFRLLNNELPEKWAVKLTPVVGEIFEKLINTESRSYSTGFNRNQILNSHNSHHEKYDTPHVTKTFLSGPDPKKGHSLITEEQFINYYKDKI